MPLKVYKATYTLDVMAVELHACMYAYAHSGREERERTLRTGRQML